MALANVEKFVVLIMLVPMVLALHDTKAHDGRIHLAQGLVVPLIHAGICKRLLLDHLQGLIINVQSCLVWKALRFRHC